MKDTRYKIIDIGLLAGIAMLPWAAFTLLYFLVK